MSKKLPAIRIIGMAIITATLVCQALLAQDTTMRCGNLTITLSCPGCTAAGITCEDGMVTGYICDYCEKDAPMPIVTGQ